MPRRTNRGGGGPPSGRPIYIPQSGVGNPHEVDFFYTQSRDPGQGQPAEPSVLYDPASDPINNPIPREKASEIKQFTGYFLSQMRQRTTFVQMPAFQMPPFFAQPKIIISHTTVPAGATFILIRHEVAARYRTLLVCCGMSTDSPLAVHNGQIVFGFQIQGGQRIDYLEHQVGGANGVTKPTQFGFTPFLPGTLCEPFCFLSNGLQFLVSGPQALDLVAINNSAAAVEICLLLGLYKYQTPVVTEHAKSDLQE